MKKMFFTAIALVAFSATSMANTIEVKEVVIPVEEKKEVVILKATPCQEAAMDAYEISMAYFCYMYDACEENVVFLNNLMSVCH